MDKEIPFAVKEGIPVLPLLQENVIYSYAEKSGGLQFLYKYDNDNTAVPCTEKLCTLLFDGKTRI